MGFREQYKEARAFTIELPGGISLRVRKPDMMLVMEFRKKVSVSIRTLAELRAMEAPDATRIEELQLTLYQDARDLVQAMLAQCSVEPRIVPEQADADADTSGNTICFDELDGDDIEAIRTALFGSLGMTAQQGIEVSPFRKPADVGGVCGEVELPPQQPDS